MTIQAEETSKVFRGNSIVQLIILCMIIGGSSLYRKLHIKHVDYLPPEFYWFPYRNNHQRSNITSQDKRSSCSQRYVIAHLFHFSRVQMILRIEDRRAKNARDAYHYHQGTLKETLVAFFQAFFNVIPCVKTIVKMDQSLPEV